MTSPDPLRRIRLAAYLFPPAGLVLLWCSRGVSLARKLVGSIGLLLYTVVYLAAILGLLLATTDLEIEWQGGFPPVLTFHKTVPDYDAVEAHRAAQTNRAAPHPAPAAPDSGVWNGFRGHDRTGVYSEVALATNWPAAGLPLVWKQPCGAGYASFAIAGGRLFTIEQRRQKEVVVAYEASSGRELWAHSYNAQFEEPLGGEGPRATPACVDGLVYSLGAMGDLFCLRAENGDVVWHKNVLSDNAAELLTYGMAASPLVEGEMVIVAAGGQGASVVAYGREDGRKLWGSLDDPAAYSSPMVVELAGQQQLLVVTEKRAVGLSLTGQLLWSFPWVVNQGNRNIAQPILLPDNRLFLSAGYGTGCAVIEIRNEGGAFTAREVWRNRHLKNKFTSSVFWQGHIYGLDEDILVCLDAATGERRWKEGRYGYGQLLLVKEPAAETAVAHLLILTGDGQLALVQATAEEHREPARFQAITGKTWNHPAVAAGRIYVRNLVEMACFEAVAP